MKDGSDGEIYDGQRELIVENISNEEIEKMKEDGMNDKEVDAMINFEANWQKPNRLTNQQYNFSKGRVFFTCKCQLRNRT